MDQQLHKWLATPDPIPEKRPEDVFTIYDYMAAKNLTRAGAEARLRGLKDRGVVEVTKFREKGKVYNGYRLKSKGDQGNGDHGERAGNSSVRSRRR